MKWKKASKIVSNKYLKYSLLLISGIFIGWLVFHPSQKTGEKHDHSAAVAQSTVWTCSMHPHIRMDEPGKCPICGMDLIPLVQNNSASVDPESIHLTAEAAQLANVLTSIVSIQKPVKEVRLYGKVQADERLLQSQVAYVPGRIEKLNIDFTGESVVKGQVLAQVYSPELVNAQQELLESAKTKQTQPAIYEAAKEKLLQWKLTENQIKSIEESGSVQNTVDILSTTNGIVTARRVNSGDYISQGSVLFEIADLSKVWVMFDAYESDLQFLGKGEKISFTLQSLPGENYTANIVFVDPVINPVTRVAKVRVEIGNHSGKLKPEMYATGIVSSNLNEYDDNLVIPKSAVLWTGKRSIVYVKQPDLVEPVFKIREIGLGPMVGDSYIVTDGLSEGEEIVTSGAFSVDAAAQLEGKPSMMNHDGGKTSLMSEIEMPDDKNESDMEFALQLNTVFDHYMLLQKAFVQSDAKKVSSAAQIVKKTIAGVDMKQLTKDQSIKWSDISGKLNKQIDLIASSGDIEEQRAAFVSFNDQFYKVVKLFGLMGKTVYYQFCPMANDGKGAYWLSDIKEILNPYYGDAMLTCGETKEVIKK